MTPLPAHFCPGCGQQAKMITLRYPWHFCPSCLALATDGDGRRLEFHNIDMSGGFQWRRPGEAHVEASGAICLILGRPVIVREARFGGIVAEPLSAGSPPEGYDDLR